MDCEQTMLYCIYQAAFLDLCNKPVHQKNQDPGDMKAQIEFGVHPL